MAESTTAVNVCGGGGELLQVQELAAAAVMLVRLLRAADSWECYSRLQYLY